jgi:hypothetical protein
MAGESGTLPPTPRRRLWVSGPGLVLGEPDPASNSQSVYVGDADNDKADHFTCR